MAGDHTAGLHPSDLLDAKLCRSLLRKALDLIRQAGRPNETDMILLHGMLFDEILDQPEVGSGVEGLSEKSRKVVCLLFAASEFADAERSSSSISPCVIRMWVSRWSPSVKASIEREIVMSFSQQPDFICPAFSRIVSRCSRRRRF